VDSRQSSRRRFLALMGASGAFGAGVGCSQVDRGQVVPYTKRPPEVIPGVANHYASTFCEGLSALGVLVKTREGRPIHVEGNDEHPRLEGKTTLRAMADVLGLYDPDRLRQPLVDGRAASWEAAEGAILPVLREAQTSGKPVLLLTGANLSPTREALIGDLRQVLPGLRHVAWEAAAGTPGGGAAPRPRLDRASLIVAFEADLLSGDDPRAIADFAAARRPERPEGGMNRLYVFEGGMTLTGANADHRLTLKPSQAATLALGLAHALHGVGLALPPGWDETSLEGRDLDRTAGEAGIDPALLHALVADLAGAGRDALVACGPALPPEAHAACSLLNRMLGGEGHTLDAASAAPPARLASGGELAEVFGAMASGEFAAAVYWGANPGYAFPEAEAWTSAVAGTPLNVRLGQHADETASDCGVVLPEHHWLEAWGDYESSDDLLTLQQPAIGPLYDTRQGEDVLLSWVRALGGAVTAPDYHQYLQERWRREHYPAGSSVPFERFWHASLHEGVLRRPTEPRPPAEPDALGVSATGAPAEGFELLLSPGLAVYDGRYANNGWLQELPDPVTKLTWGNVVALSSQDARELGVGDGDVVRLEAGQRSVEVPVLVQPGQAAGVVSATLGYGRRAGSVAEGVGANLYPLVDVASPAPRLRLGVRLVPVGRRVELPLTQTHHSMEGRDIVRSHALGQHVEHVKHELPTLYPDLEFPGERWGMSIDLSACVGCSACVVACHSENNIPVVGPEQVLRSREMHWIRVDRYHDGDTTVFQPMLCQHCDNAPCETVCPVAATNQSPDGLNQMVYNRCIGTRYCANNCPYKVRRFNFFEYMADKREPESLAFNPEVSVRPRGVMEKCTFCVQRIQDVRQRAKIDGRPIGDGEVQPACAAACPASAIVFGDLNRTDSQVSRLSHSERGYKVLEELGARPAVTYLARVTNPGGAPEEAKHEPGGGGHGD